MRKFIWLIAVLGIVSCNTTKENFATVSGKVLNKVPEVSVQGQTYNKSIAVNEDLSFTDTLQIKEGMYMLNYGHGRTTLFLKPGYNINMEVVSDGKVNFTGKGAESNSFLEEKREFFMSDYADPNSYFPLEEEAYNNRMAEAKAKLNESTVDKTMVDSSVVALINGSSERLFGYIESSYPSMHASLVKLKKGNPSPVFTDYENFKGGKTSLSDLKGKFVYIDIWATWCGPCKREIPNLKALEEEFHGKDIHFVSISVDNIDGRRGSHDSWLKMVEEEELGGIQLFADNDFNSQFIKDYGINSIPRFILLDPKGNIVDANAMRPSNPGIKAYFKELGI